MVRLRAIATVMLWAACAGPAAAQSFQTEAARYQAAQAECRVAMERRTAAPRCDERCRTQAEAGRQRCLATAEQRYRAALRRVFQIRY